MINACTNSSPTQIVKVYKDIYILLILFFQLKMWEKITDEEN